MADANSQNGQIEFCDKKLNGNTNNHASDASNDKIHSDNLNGTTFDSPNKELDICQNREQEKLPQNGIKNGAQHQVNKAALDGGWGWVVVACSMMATTVVGGSYITFSLLYVDLVEAFSTTKAVAGWIGSIHIGSGNFFGIFFSVAIHRFGSRVVCIVGALMAALGYFLSAFATNIVYMYFTYGILAGSGAGMIVMSSIVIVQQYFDKRRAVAGAFAVGGFSFGALFAGPFIRFIMDRYAWRGTLIIYAGIFLQIVITACAYRPLASFLPKKASSPDVLSNRNKDDGFKSECEAEVARKESGCHRLGHFFCAVFDFSLLRDPALLLYIIANFFVHIGVNVFYQHTPSRAAFYQMDPQLIALLPTVTGATTGVTRLVFGFVANAPGVNRLLQFSFSTIAAGVIQTTTTFASTFPIFALYGVLQGIANGCFFCILSTILVDLKGVQNIARSQAMLAISVGIAVLISTPFAGFLFDITQKYDLSFLVTGFCTVFGGFLGLVAAFLQYWHFRRTNGGQII